MSDYNGQDMRGSDAGQLSAIAMTAMVASVGNPDSQASPTYGVDSRAIVTPDVQVRVCSGVRADYRRQLRF